MSTDERNKHPRIYGAEAKRRCHREIHGCVVAVSATHTRCPEWWRDNRRRRLQSWSGTLRVIDVLIDGGAPDDICRHVPAVLKEYCEDRLAERRARSGDGTPKRAA